MITEVGAEAQSDVDDIPGERGLEAWRKLVQSFDPASAQANLILMSLSFIHCTQQQSS